MLVTWIVAAGLIIFAQAATRKIKPIPSGIQNFWEWLVESLYNFLEGVIGRSLVRKTFWFFATVFIFILFLNWFGLIPGVGTVGWGHHDPATNSFHVDRPLLRGANADLNLTLAMACVFFVLWLIWAIQANGIGGFIHAFVWAQRRNVWLPQGNHDHCVLPRRLARNRLDPLSAGVAQLSVVREHLRGGKHAGSNG